MQDLWKDKKETGPTQGGSLDAWPNKANPGTTNPGAPAGNASSAVKQSAGGTTRDDYWANKELRDLEKERIYREEDIPAIRRSTSYQVASDIVAAAVAADACSFGSAAKGKRFDMLLAMLDLAADHVFAKLNGEDLDLGADEEPVQGEEADLG